MFRRLRVDGTGGQKILAQRVRNHDRLDPCVERPRGIVRLLRSYLSFRRRLTRLRPVALASSLSLPSLLVLLVRHFVVQSPRYWQSLVDVGRGSMAELH